MNIKQAYYIKTIYECGTITAAAKQLFVSQPSLSQMLRQVEDELGMPIFERRVTPMTLTYAGETYMQAANQILQINAQLDMQIGEMKKERSGRIRMGISVSRGIEILPRLIPCFYAVYPKVKIELTECGSAELEELLLDGKIDLALAAIEPSRQDIRYQLIEEESVGIIAGASSELAKRFPDGTHIDLMDTESERFVVLMNGHSSRLIQDQLFTKYNFHPRILQETDSLEIGRHIAMEAGACMLLPSVYADGYVRHMNGKFFPLKDYKNDRHFYACTRKDDFVPRYTRDLIDMVGSILDKQNYT